MSGAGYYSLSIFDYDFNRIYNFQATELSGVPPVPVSSYSLPVGFLEARPLYRWRVHPRREYYDDNVDNGGGIPGSSTWDSPVLATSTPVDDENTGNGNGDGMPDYWEALHGLDPMADDADGDLDGDGLSNVQEFQHATDPENPDTDGDGLSDSAEVALGTRPRSMDSDDDGVIDSTDNCPIIFNPDQADADNDGIGDACDLLNDSDLDGLPDAWEQQIVDADPGDSIQDVTDVLPGDDFDGDGLSNQEEFNNSTSPLTIDSDNDGWSDLQEIQGNTSAIDPIVFPILVDFTVGGPGASDLNLGDTTYPLATLHAAVSRINSLADGAYGLTLAAGTYSFANGEANQPLAIEQDLSIVGAGNTLTTIDGAGASAWTTGIRFPPVRPTSACRA